MGGLAGWTAGEHPLGTHRRRSIVVARFAGFTKGAAAGRYSNRAKKRKVVCLVDHQVSNCFYCNIMASTSPKRKHEITGMDVLQDQGDPDEHLTEAEKSMREEELSFYSNSENEYGDDNIWGLLSGVGGNIYEW